MRKHAALIIALLALVLSVTGVADAARQAAIRVVSKPRPNAVLRLDKQGQVPGQGDPDRRPRARGDPARRRAPPTS